MSVSQVYAELDRVSTVLATTNGRDKIMRFVDYSTRALSYYLSQAAPKHPQVATVKSVEAHLM